MINRVVRVKCGVSEGRKKRCARLLCAVEIVDGKVTTDALMAGLAEVHGALSDTERLGIWWWGEEDETPEWVTLPCPNHGQIRVSLLDIERARSAVLVDKGGNVVSIT